MPMTAKNSFSLKDFFIISARVFVQILFVLFGVFVPYLLNELSKLPFIPPISNTVSWENQLVWAVLFFLMSSSLLARLQRKYQERRQLIEKEEDIDKIVREISTCLGPILRIANDTVEVVNHFDKERYFSESSEIDVATLSGNITLELRKKDTLEKIIHRKNHSKMRCLIGNPFSDLIISRYKYDEPAHKKAGYLQIVQNLITLFNAREGWFRNTLTDNPKDILKIKEKLKISVYNSYPMLAIFRGDNSIFMSYYAYKEIDTKWIKTDATSPFGKDLCTHFNELFADSVSISEWVVENFDKFNEDSKNNLLFSSYYSGIFVINNEDKFIFQNRDDKEGIHNPGKLSVFGGRSVGSGGHILNCELTCGVLA